VQPKQDEPVRINYDGVKKRTIAFLHICDSLPSRLPARWREAKTYSFSVLSFGPGFQTNPWSNPESEISRGPYQRIPAPLASSTMAMNQAQFSIIPW
jgi:hypothetical protein